MTRNFPATNQASVIPKNYTYMNHNTGLVETICDSIVSKCRSETCGSSMGSPLPQNLALNLPMVQNNNSLSPTSSSSCSPNNNDTTNQNRITPVNDINNQKEDKEISNLWSNKAPTNNIETDLPTIAPENSILHEHHDLFGLKAINDNLNNLPTIDQESTVLNASNTWYDVFTNTTLIPIPVQQKNQEFYNDNSYFFINSHLLDNMEW